MQYSRREFGRLALAGVPATLLGKSWIDDPVRR